MSAVPSGLGAAGRRFWRTVTKDYDLGPDELQTLLQVCRTVDELETLNDALTDASATVPGSKGQPVINPLFAEVRNHRLVLARLLKTLGLPSEDEQPESQTTKMARAAAQERWRQQRERDGRRSYGSA